MLTWLISGIIDNISELVTTVVTLVTTFITELGANAQRLIDAGFKVLTDFLKGIGDNVKDVVTTVGTIVTEFVTAVSDSFQDFVDAGFEALTDFLNGITDNIEDVGEAVKKIILKFIEVVTTKTNEVAEKGADLIIAFIDELAATIERKAPELRAAGGRLAAAIADGFTGGMASKAGDMIGSVTGSIGGAISKGWEMLKPGSPSKVFRAMGENAADGFALGLDKDDSAEQSSAALADRVRKSFEEIISHIPDTFDGIDEFSPVIRPVLDLTEVQAGAKGIDGMMAVGALDPEVSFSRARTIATTDDLTGTEDQTPQPSGPTEVTFEQNIYSPSALSTNDIYRNTKSQIALAKEELNI